MLPATANSNGPVSWTPERIEGLGKFLAAARWLVAPVHAAEAATERPTRPVQAHEPVEAGNEGGADSDSADDGLSALLASIADEVHSRVASVLAGLSAEFAGRIAHARKTLPPNQVQGAVAVLKQMQKAAAKAVRENAGSEVKARQKAARVQRRRKALKAIRSIVTANPPLP